ncbi:MAG: adenosyl-hopene transferase HpnH [Planctomycetes bacterium]|nr:adenosyl-hopene transferase HpnH [Planctomycetota bacterium]
MAVPVSQMWTVATYVLGKKLRGVKRYPLVLMLEPLFRCNLACAGCGKIQYPGHVLKRNLTPEECFRAVDECGAPMVSIPGGEPLMHPRIVDIVKGLVERRKYVYLCTNAILLREKVEDFPVSKYLTFSVHMDGLEEEHDFAVCREGIYAKALEGIRAAIRLGHRVTTNTTLFQGADPARVRAFFDEMMEVGVEGMMLSPGYSYSKAPDQEHFLKRRQTADLFREILAEPKKGWKFNQSPLFLQFLMGMRDYDCTPWGNPTFNLFGWQKPCYLLQEGYAPSFRELMEETEWERYGHRNNDKCKDCMVHSGYEASAVDATFGRMSGFFSTVFATIMGYAFGVARRGFRTRKLGIGPLVELVREPEPEPETVAATVDAAPVGCGSGCARGNENEHGGAHGVEAFQRKVGARE